jgi:hypothetical protein
LNPPFKIIAFLLTGFTFTFQSCFLIKIPVDTKHVSIKDTVKVYHFIVSPNKKLVADSNLVKAYIYESKSAYNWITKEARKHGETLSFREHWPSNKDSSLKKTFVFKLPSTNLTILARNRNGFRKWVNKTVENEKKRQILMNWRENLFNSLAANVKDSLIAKIIQSNSSSRSGKQLVVVHVLKAKKSKVFGFYSNNSAFIGLNKSATIAHESIHHLGAPDLYIHKYWFGKRRRTVKKELPDEIMNNTRGNDSNYAYLSNYTAYCIGWDEELDKKYKPLMKMNLQAMFNFMFWLR